MKLTHNVTLFEVVPALGGPYDLEVFGFGAANLDEAEREGARFAEQFKARSGREHKVKIKLFCTSCSARGIKPGCKRKPCPACAGRGSVDLQTAAAA